MSTAVPALVASFGAVAHAGGALPTGGQVIGGSATINQTSATQMQITSTTARSAISWQDFSIGAGNSVNVTQPNAASTQLEQVRGTNVSQIFGSLTSNGSIVIANPNGIWFGPNAQVDVAGLAAVAAKPTSADVQTFINGGSLNLSQASNANAAVVNQGNISISNAGLAAFVAPGVRNDGIIQARLGTVQLSSGTTATLDFYGDGLVSIAVSGQTLAQAIDPSTGKPLGSAVTNTGTLNADGGTVLVTANVASNVVDNVINTSGVIQAQSVSQQNGQIVLDGGPTGAVQVAGSLDASGTASGQTGGSVQVTGQTVNVASNTVLDASGDQAGGTVYVGGGVHGQGTTHVATTTTVAKGASIKANALTSGNGGTVAVWSAQSTSFDGSIDAKGGTQGGNGGFVETSGHQLSLGPDASVSASALRGAAGEWLLDPGNVTIVASPGTTTTTGSTDTFQPSSGASDATILNTDLETPLNAGTNVVVTTTNAGTSAGTGAGNIEVNASISWNSGSTSTTLTLDAANNIDVNAAISGTASAGQTASLAMNAGNVVTIAAPISMSGSVHASGGLGTGGVVFSDGTDPTLVATGGGQTYSSSVDVAQNTVLSDTSTGGVTFGTDVGGDNVSSLTISGNASFGGNYGIIHHSGVFHTGSGSLLVTGKTSLSSSTGFVTPDNGSLTFDSDVTIVAGTFVQIGANAGVTFGGKLDGDADVVFEGSGSVNFEGAVGSVTPLEDLVVGGGASFSGGTVKTQGGGGLHPGQTYSGPVSLGGDTTFTDSGGNAITFVSTVAGAHALSASSSGGVVFSAAVGGGTALASVTIGSPATLDNSITTTGGQTYSGAVTLGASTVTLSDGSTAGITFGSTVTDAGAGDTLDVTQGATTFSGSVSIGSLATQAVTFDVTSGSIATTGGQTYSGAITLGGDTLLEATASTATITFGQATTYNSADNLAVLAGGSLDINASIQNAGTGNVILVAGWDGTAPTSAANITNLISGTHYGSTGDNVVIGNGSQGATVAVGSASGATNVLGDNVTLRGSAVGDSNYLTAGHNGTGAQIGFNVPSGGTAAASGGITVDALGAVLLQGGSGNSGFAQIGHGGVGAGSSTSVRTQSLTGGIVVNAASVTLANGGPNAYAQIGHGGQSFASGDNEVYLGSLSLGGDITVNASGAIALAVSNGGYAQIGHGGLEALFSTEFPTGFATTGNITVSAASLTLTNTSVLGGYAEIGHGEDPSAGETYGTPFPSNTSAGGVSGNIDITVGGTLSAPANSNVLIGSRAAGTVTTPLFIEARDFSGGIGATTFANTANGQVVVAVTDPAGYITGAIAAAGGNTFALLTKGELNTTGAISGDAPIDLIGGWNGTSGVPSAGGTFDLSTGTGALHAGAYGNGSAGSNGISLGANVSVSGSNGVTLAGPVTLTNNNVDLTGSTVTVLSTLDSDTTARNLTVTGNGVFDGAVGGMHPLNAVDVTGTALLAGGTVDTTTGQTYGGAVTLGGNTTFTPGSGSTVAFDGTVGGAFALDVTQGATTFDGAVTVASLTTQAVTFDLTSSSIATTGGQTYSGAATLGANTTLSDTGGGITFGNTVGGAFVLDVTQGAATFDGAVNVGQLIAQAATLDADVTTSAGQTYSGGVTLGASVTLTDSAGSPIDFLSTLAGGGNNLTIIDDTLPVFGGTVSAIGTATLAPFTPGDTIAVGKSTQAPLAIGQTVSYDFSTGAVATLAAVASTIAIGTGSNTGNITETTLTLTPALVLTNSGAGGIAISGALTAGGLTANAGSGGIALDANVTTTAGQTYGGAVALGGTITLQDRSSNNVTFNGTVDAVSAGNGSLSVNVFPDAVVFNEAVGSHAALGSLNILGAADLNGGSISTSGSSGEQYGGSVVLGTDTTLTAGVNGSVSFTLVGGTITGAHGLTIAATNGSVGLGESINVSSLSITDTAGEIEIEAPNFTTTGSGGQLYAGRVGLIQDATLSAGGSGGVTFTKTIDGGHNLVVSTTGTVSLGGTVGGGTHLASLTIDSGPGDLTISAPTIVTTGGQVYDHPVVLAASTTLTAGGSGVDFSAMVDSSGTGVTTDGHGLTVSGAATFGGAVGGNFALGSLVVTGTTALDGGTVDTIGSQTYSGAITLGGNTTLDSAAGDGAIDFGSSVNGASDTLTINTGTGGVIFSGFDFNVANLTIIGPETLNTGTYTLTGGTLANSSGIGFEGTLDFAQDTTFASAVTLDADTSIVTTSGSAAITFGSTVNGGFGLTVNTAGTTLFDSTVGNSAPLTHLTVDGPATLGANVITSGNQTYSGTITLGGDVLLEATAATATITFDGAISYNNAINFAVLSGGPIDVNASIQNGGSGAVSLIAGWDGTAPTSAADVSNLIAGHDYGQGANGNVVIGTGAQTTTVAVGTELGTTTVAGANVTLSGGTTGGAQIGFNVPAGQSGSASGNIAVDATGALALDGNDSQGYAQIGHGGVNAANSGTDSLSLSGGITVDAASVTLAGGSGTQAYAQIGHGGDSAFGVNVVNGGPTGALSVSGNITVGATGNIALQGGSFQDGYAQIGNGGGSFALEASPSSFSLGGNVTVTSGGTISLTSGNNSVAQIGLGGVGAFNGYAGFGLAGNIAVDAGTLTMTGDGITERSQTAVIGYTGDANQFFGSVNGDIDIRVTNTFTNSGGFIGSDGNGGTLPIYVQAKALSGFGPNDLAQDTGLGEVVVAITDPGTFNVATISSGGGNPFALVTEGALNVTGPITNGGDVVLVSGWNGSSGAATFGSGSAFDLSAVTGVLSSAANYGNGGNGITFSADILSTGGNIGLAGPVKLVTSELFTATTTTFYSTVDSNGATPENLSVQNNAVFDGAVGTIHPIGDLEVFSPGVGVGTATISGGTVITTAGQIYNGNVVLGAATTLNDSSGSTSAIQFFGTVGDGGNNHALDITQGAADFGGNVTVGTLSTQAASVVVGGTITTTHGQTYGGAVTLALDTKLVANNNSGVTFDSTIDSESGNHALSISNGGGTTTFFGAIGGGTALSTLTVGAAQLDGGLIKTTNGQNYGGISPDRNTTLGADATLTNSGGRVTFGFDVGGGYNLVINANNSTNVLFAAGVGNNSETALKSLTINGSGGTIQFNFDGATTTNGQYYGNPVVLETGNPTAAFSAGTGIVFTDTITDHNGNAGLVVTNGATTFEGSVNVSSVTTQAVTFDVTSGSVSTSGGQTYSGAATLGADTTLSDSGTAGITFGSTVGGAHALDVTQGATTFDDTVNVGSLSVQAANIDGGSVATTGGQTYSGTVTLGGATTFDTTDAGANAAGAHIAFDAAGTSVDDGNHNVTLDAGTGGAIAVTGSWTGGGTPTETLLIENSGGATFSGAVSVGTVSIATTTGTVSFLGALTATDFDTSAGGYAVAIAGDGSSIEHAVVFHNTGGVTLGGGSGTTLDFDTGVTSIAGMTTLAGAIHSDPSTGGQKYGAVTLAADTDLTESAAGTISFSGDVNSASGQHFALTINTPGFGRTSFGGSVGNSQPLSSLDITSGADPTIVGGTLIETTGDQTYGNPLSLTNSNGFTFESTTGGTIGLPSVTANAGVTVIDLTGTTDLTGSLFTTDGSQVWDTGLGLPANDFVFDAQGTTSDITIGVSTSLNSGHGLTFLAGRDIVFDAGVQNASGGAINVVAGWDGSSGLSSGSFSFGDLVAANTTAHQSYGNNSGSVFVNNAAGTVGVVIGSAGGATDIAGFDIALQGGSGANAFAQLGYHGDIGNAPITVLAADNVTLVGGSGTSAYAQIGHGGELVDTNVNLGAVTLGGAIDVSAVGNIVLQGGSGNAFAGTGAYAQIGHGGLGFAANIGASDTTIGALSVTGDITVTSTGGNGTISLTGGHQWAYAQIGHGGMAFAENQTNSNNETLASVTLSGNITVGAPGNVSLAGGTATDDAFDAYAQIGHGGDAALSDIGIALTVTGATTVGGTISVSSSSGSVSLGGNDDYAYAQIGHGGLTFGTFGTFADVNVTGDITVTGANGVSLAGGAGSTVGPDSTNTGAYAQIGHGGLATLSGVTAGAVKLDGAITVDGGTGGISLTGGSAEGINGAPGGDSYAQIGLGGDSAFIGANLASLSVGSTAGTIGVSTGGTVALNGGSGSNDYAQIGDGGFEFASSATVGTTVSSVFSGGTVALSGDITVGAASVTLSGDTGSNGTFAYVQIGHGGAAALYNTTAGDVTVDGDVSVTANAGDISLTAGSGDAGYAQIGHGGAFFASAYNFDSLSGSGATFGSVTLDGNVSVKATNTGGTSGGVFLTGGRDPDAYAQIGHGGSYAFAGAASCGCSGGPITLAGLTIGGAGEAITVIADENISLTGGSSDGAYVQIGHGGYAFASDATVGTTTTAGFTGGAVTVSGDITLTTGNGYNFNAIGGSGDGAYVQVGHGGYAFAAGSSGGSATIGGDIDVTAPNGSAFVVSGTNTYAYAQIGHGGAFAFTDATVSPTYAGTVSVNADDLGVGSFSPFSYGVIGSGDPLPTFAGGNGTLSGTVDVTTVGDQDYFVGFTDVILAPGTYGTSNGTISFSDGSVGIATVVLSGSITIENSTTEWGRVLVPTGLNTPPTYPDMTFVLSGQDTTFTDDVGNDDGLGHGTLDRVGTLSVSGGGNFTIVSPAVVYVDIFTDSHMTGTVDFGHTLDVLNQALIGDPFIGDLVCASGGTSCIVGIDGFHLTSGLDFQDQTLHLFDIQYALSNPGLNLLAGGVNPQAGCTAEEKQANGGSCPAGSGDATGFGNQFLSGTKP